MKVTIYHNPRCSKSRGTLALLREHDADIEVVEYLKTPPDAACLRRLVDQLGLRPRDVVRSGEDVFHELGLNDLSVNDDTLIDAMVANPILIERPIVVAGDRAVIGRPPQAVHALFEE